jgi:hypothetical protein
MMQEILAIEAQLFKTGPRNIGELKFGLFRGARRLAPFGNVLDARPRRLNHLIMGAAALVNVSVTKSHRYIIN